MWILPFGLKHDKKKDINKLFHIDRWTGEVAHYHYVTKSCIINTTNIETELKIS